MYVRFVDPEDPTHELSPPSEEDHLSDDEAIWKTPAL